MNESIKIIFGSILRGIKNAGRLTGGFLPFVIPIVVLIIENISKKPKTIQEFFTNDPATFWTIIVLLTFYLLILIPCIYWELVRIIPRIEIVPQNGSKDVAIIIYNNEIEDLCDLRVKLIEKRFLMRNIVETPSSINPSVDLRNCFFRLESDRIDYGSHLVVKIAEHKGSLGFLLYPEVFDNFFEQHNSMDNANYKIVLEIKGKIDGKPIVPKRFVGKIKYWRQEITTTIETSTPTESIHKTIYSIKWDDVNALNAL